MSPPAWADTDLTALTSAERAAFHAEIRATLLADPAVITRALTPPDPYRAAVEDDLALIARHAAQLFDPARAALGPAEAPQRMALFLAPDCPDCAAALEEARILTRTNPLRVTLFDLSIPADRALAQALGLDQTPAYVLPRMMIRGQMPAPVLQRYLDKHF